MKNSQLKKKEKKLKIFIKKNFQKILHNPNTQLEMENQKNHWGCDTFLPAQGGFFGTDVESSLYRVIMVSCREIFIKFLPHVFFNRINFRRIADQANFSIWLVLNNDTIKLSFFPYKFL